MKHLVGLAIDIDGVLIRGHSALPFAKRGLQKLKDFGVPFVMLTNGGGVLEEEKAESLSNLLDFQVEPNQLILSHTPMKKYLVPKYHDKKVLIVGSSKCVDVAKNYGFTKIVTVEQIFEQYPHLHPARKIIKEEHEIEGDPLPNEPIEAVMVLHDPDDWSLEIQVVSDILYTGFPPGNHINGKQIPFYRSNPDFIWSSSHNIPRFAQGAFTEALSHLYEKMHDQPLVINSFGKPLQITYDYCSEILYKQAIERGLIERTEDDDGNYHKYFEYLYGIGDNPAADIRGANNAGDNWRSILVRTGIFKGDDNDPNDPADFVYDNIEEAVNSLVNDHKL